MSATRTTGPRSSVIRTTRLFRILTAAAALQKEKYRFQGVIEMEHPIPEGSDLMTELTKCIAYSKNALV